MNTVNIDLIPEHKRDAVIVAANARERARAERKSMREYVHEAVETYPNMGFVYVRRVNENDEVQHFGGLTLAFLPPNKSERGGTHSRVQVAMATCRSVDRFDKLAGRAYAARYLLSGRYLEITLPLTFRFSEQLKQLFWPMANTNAASMHSQLVHSSDLLADDDDDGDYEDFDEDAGRNESFKL